MSNLFYLSLGSNIGDREGHLREAIERLRAHGSVISVSSLFETEPVEVSDQAWFLNCAIAIESPEEPEQLMANILSIEKTMGRQRTQKKGPRTIDIDILLAGDSIVDTTDLSIPHPAMAKRRFVLEPLAEIAPAARHPVLEKTVRELLDSLPAGQSVHRLATDCS